MKESRQGFWVGLFALVGLAALCVLIVLFGQMTFWGPSAGAYIINARFREASGIRAGTLVTIGGLEVGRVHQVGFVNPAHFEEGVNVELVFNKGYKLREGARAATNEPGLGEGRPPIRIQPGPTDAPYLPPGAVIKGSITSAVESLIPKQIVDNFEKTSTHIGEAAAALTPVLRDLHGLLEARSPQAVDQPGGPSGNLASTIARADSSFKYINEVIGNPEVQSNLRASIDNLYKMTEDGKVVIADFRKTASDVNETAKDAKLLIEKTSAAVDEIRTDFGQFAQAASNDMDILSKVLTRVDTLIQNVEKGEGTVGMLFTDDRLYEAVTLTFRRIASTAEEFRTLLQEWAKRGLRIGL